MLNRLRLIAACLAGPLLLTQCVTTQLTSEPQSLPAGVVRGPDGSLYYDPSGGQPGQPGAVNMAAPPDYISHWDGGPGNGPARIRINLAEQTAYFYKGDVLVGKSWLSTGTSTHPTPRGNFRIIQKDKWHRSSRYGAFVDGAGNVVDGDVDIKKDPVPPGLRFEGAKMTNFMRLTHDGVGMHAGFLPGYPASHGCIRMPEWMSEHFFNNVQIGTPVVIE